MKMSKSVCLTKKAQFDVISVNHDFVLSQLRSLYDGLNQYEKGDWSCLEYPFDCFIAFIVRSHTCYFSQDLIFFYFGVLFERVHEFAFRFHISFLDDPLYLAMAIKMLEQLIASIENIDSQFQFISLFDLSSFDGDFEVEEGSL